MPRIPAPAAALVFSLVLALATPGHADSLDERNASTQSKRAAAAAQVGAAKADDAQLEAAVRELDTSVTAQSSSTDAAQQAASAAQVAVGSAEARLAATEARMSDLRGAAASLAVRAYVHPGGDPLMQLLGSADLGEASRRETLLNHVASTDRDLLGQLRATREDQEGEQTDLNRLRDQADARRKAAASHLDELKAARDSQARLKGALDERIQEYQTEVDGLSRDQATIEALLRARLSSSAGGPSLAAVRPGQESSYGLIWPVDAPVTSPFGFRWGRMHTGIDLGAGSGTPIRAAKAGTVVSSDNDAGGYGLLTVIDHGGGLTTLYAHQSQSAVSGGSSVTQGQIIAYVGCSGHCTGPHLHFETRIDGNPENPASFLR